MKKTVISVLGDSIADGVVLRQNGATGLKNWPDIVAETLDAEVHTFGVGGSSTYGGLDRVSQLENVKSDLVLIEFGMNDSIITNEKGDDAVPIKAFGDNLLKLCNTVSENGATPILMTPNRVIEEYYYDRHPAAWYEKAGGANAQIERYRNEILKIGKEHNIPVIDIMQAYDDNIEQIYTLLRSEKNGNFRDGVHPYGEGIKLYAETVCKSIEKLMKSK